MCGICGVVRASGLQPNHGELIEGMMGLMRHRGPDDSGIWSDRIAALGHRRLSIIDLSATGHQPMLSEDGDKVLVFNGEIYNYRELRRQFESQLHFRFHNDSEIILKLYEEFGPECLRYLRGMFAFAIWDTQKQQLFFARDRAGKKPFFYTLQGGTFAFASELRALMASTDLHFSVRDESIYHYLSLGYIPAPTTVFCEAFKLPPAHYGILRNGELKTERYWRVSHETREWKDEEVQDRFEELFRESVRLRMIADVPLGAFLSGGIDSTSVVSMMTSLSQDRVKTFTIRFDEAAYDESAAAREVAETLNTDHTELTVNPGSVEVLEKLAWHYSEPYADSSAIPTYYLARMTSAHVKVAMNGDGGDELFGGYPRYRLDRLARSKRLPAAIESAIQSVPFNMRYVWRIRKFLEDRAFPLPLIYFRRVCLFNEEEKRGILSDRFLETSGPWSSLKWMEARFADYESVPYPENLMAVDMDSYLPEDLLVKVDVATMACSLEARSPLLDHELMEFAGSLPIKWKMRGRTSKFLLKQYLNGKVPASLVARPKMGFGVPIQSWFRKEWSDYLRENLLNSVSMQRGYFTKAAIERLIRRHQSGMFDNTQKLYALLMLELWHQTFVDSKKTQSHEDTKISQAKN